MCDHLDSVLQFRDLFFRVPDRSVKAFLDQLVMQQPRHLFPEELAINLTGKAVRGSGLDCLETADFIVGHKQYLRGIDASANDGQ